MRSSIYIIHNFTNTHYLPPKKMRPYIKNNARARMRSSNFNQNQNLILSIISEIAEEPPINNKEVKILPIVVKFDINPSAQTISKS